MIRLSGQVVGIELDHPSRMGDRLGVLVTVSCLVGGRLFSVELPLTCADADSLLGAVVEIAISRTVDA